MMKYRNYLKLFNNKWNKMKRISRQREKEQTKKENGQKKNTRGQKKNVRGQKNKARGHIEEQDDLSKKKTTISQLQDYIKTLKERYPDITLHLEQLNGEELEITKWLKEIDTINKNKIKGEVSEEKWRSNREKHVKLLRRVGNIHQAIGEKKRSLFEYVNAISIYETGIVQCGNEVPELDQYVKDKKAALDLFFKQCIGTESPNNYFMDEDTNKEKLNDIRSDLRNRILDLDTNEACYCYKAGITHKERMDREGERVKQNGEIFKWILNEMRKFVSTLVEQSIALLNFHETDFALIAFGSFSRTETTPFSDLEFAVVQNSDKLEMEPEYRESIEKLVMILHLKFLSFGETVLPAMAIPSLNDTDQNDITKDWYLDLRRFVSIKQGISFDGLMPHANKTPYFVSPQYQSFQLTNTKAAFIANYSNMKENELKQVLYFFKGDFTTIFGDESIEVEMKECFKKNSEQRQTILKLIKSELKEDLVKHSCIKKIYDSKYKKELIKKESLHVKKELYRLPSVVVNNLLHLLNSNANSIWDVHDLEGLENDNIHHLKMALSNAAEVRLRCYAGNNGQVDEHQGKLLPDFLVSDNIGPDTFSEDLIMRYFYTAIPLAHAIEGENSAEAALEKFGKISLYDPSVLNTTIAYLLMRNTDKAKECLQEANKTFKTEDPTQLIMHILCNIYIDDDNISKPFLDKLAITVLDTKDIDSMNAYGNALLQKGHIDKAIEVLEKSVEKSVNDRRKVTSMTLLMTAYKKGNRTTEYETLMREHPEMEEINKLIYELDETKQLLKSENQKVVKMTSDIQDINQDLFQSRQTIDEEKNRRRLEVLQKYNPWRMNWQSHMMTWRK
ncbi:unnamed protein product [Owenia fusiformis]|uniref:Uncharacterized protein n=1 Tax=Owenia fusiformis TaxID=6347 RepID=A0A8J1U3W7_OWEFU|nr:unnamed protein product [Owenia fusiformis]